MFGTDGIRGRVGVEITPSLMAKVGLATKDIFKCRRVFVAHDPRESSPELVRGALDGLAGVEVSLLGMAPTPAAAFFSQLENVPALVISASHNPYYDNGVKVFAPGGRKLNDVEQSAFGELLLSRSVTAPPGRSPSRVVDASARLEEYLASAAAPVAENVADPAASAGLTGEQVASLEGMAVVVDAANGACSQTVPMLLRRLGAEVREVCCEPNGRNINEGCGSTFPQRIASETRPGEIGLAFDGDGDRVVAYDEGLVDGDFIIALCGVDRRSRGCLAGNTVVVTVMTNLGFHASMRSHDIDVVATPVGDRYVIDALEAGGWEIGGEQSGHVVFRDWAATGDGLLTAVALLSLVKRRGERLKELAAQAMTRFPQVLLNMPVPRGVDVSIAAKLLSESAVDADRSLGTDGRVLVRASGTEPMVRVMVESQDEEVVRTLAESLAEEFSEMLAGLQQIGGGD